MPIESNFAECAKWHNDCLIKAMNEVNKIMVNKTRKAQIVVCALYNMPDYPADCKRVRQYARLPLRVLNMHYERAVKVLAARSRTK